MPKRKEWGCGSTNSMSNLSPFNALLKQPVQCLQFYGFFLLRLAGGSLWLGILRQDMRAGILFLQSNACPRSHHLGFPPAPQWWAGFCFHGEGTKVGAVRLPQSIVPNSLMFSNCGGLLPPLSVVFNREHTFTTSQPKGQRWGGEPSPGKAG